MREEGREVKREGRKGIRRAKVNFVARLELRSFACLLQAGASPVETSGVQTPDLIGCSQDDKILESMRETERLGGWVECVKAGAGLPHSKKSPEGWASGRREET